MAALTTDPQDLLRPRSADGWRPGLLMALAAHGLLLVALMFSVQWRTAPKDVVEAEVWSEIPQVAAVAPPPPPSPLLQPAPPAPEAAPEPAPAPEPPPVPVRAPEPPPPPPAPPRADLAVRKDVPKPVKQRPPREVFEPDPPQVKQRLQQVRPQVPPAPKPVVKAPAASPPATDAASVQSKQALEKARQDNLRRMMANLSEDRLQSSGPSVEYAGRIKARVKPNILFTAEIPGNPVAVVEVRCAADGRIIGRKLLTPSGVSAWDDAVLRAIDRTEVLPLNEQGKVPSPMQLEFRFKDF